MTSRERFLKVIAGEMPDRVPVTLFICDGGHFLNQLCPEIDSWDHQALQLKVIEIQKTSKPTSKPPSSTSPTDAPLPMAS